MLKRGISWIRSGSKLDCFWYCGQMLCMFQLHVDTFCQIYCVEHRMTPNPGFLFVIVFSFYYFLESSQNDQSRAQTADSVKAYSKIRAFTNSGNRFKAQVNRNDGILLSTEVTLGHPSTPQEKGMVLLRNAAARVWSELMSSKKSILVDYFKVCTMFPLCCDCNVLDIHVVSACCHGGDSRAVPPQFYCAQKNLFWTYCKNRNLALLKMYGSDWRVGVHLRHVANIECTVVRVCPPSPRPDLTDVVINHVVARSGIKKSGAGLFSARNVS